MCHDPGSRPPLPPIAGGAGIAGSDDLLLEAADGTRFAAFSAKAAVPGAPGVVILPDVRGLHPFYKDLALRFAEVGVNATVLDYFGRTAGTNERPDDFDFMSHVMQTRPDSIAQDVAAAIQHVGSEAGGGSPNVFTVGFCFGGRNSFNQAARGHGLAGVIGFYGFVQKRDADDTNAPVMFVSDFECPVLGFFGGADQSISTEGVEHFRRTLEDEGVPNHIEIYDGAPHSFFDRSAEQHRDACDDAWRRMLTFIEGGHPSS